MGKIIKGNHEEVTKGGKILIEMMNSKKLKLINSMDKCKGKWTRIEGGKKSIIDYMIIRIDNEEDVVEATIDEKKIDTPYRVVKEKNGTKTIYTDHAAMMCKLKWDEKDISKSQRQQKVMTKKSYIKYKEKMKKCQKSATENMKMFKNFMMCGVRRC